MWTRRVVSSAFRRCLKVRTVGPIDASRGNCLLGAFCLFPVGGVVGHQRYTLSISLTDSFFIFSSLITDKIEVSQHPYFEIWPPSTT